MSFYKCPLNEMVGKRFDKIVVVGLKPSKRRTLCICKCDCGNEIIKSPGNIRQNERVSCGCQPTRFTNRDNHGKSKGPTYSSWMAMKRRCYGKNTILYYRYGGRGIAVCDRWKDSFPNFLEDMGERPKGMTIHRIDNDLGYFKENCRWATNEEQKNSTSKTRFLTFNGETLNITQWAKRLGLSRDKIYARLDQLGWSVEKALSVKCDNRHDRVDAPRVMFKGQLRTLLDISRETGISIWALRDRHKNGHPAIDAPYRKMTPKIKGGGQRRKLIKFAKDYVQQFVICGGGK